MDTLCSSDLVNRTRTPVNLMETPDKESWSSQNRPVAKLEKSYGKLNLVLDARRNPDGDHRSHVASYDS